MESKKILYLEDLIKFCEEQKMSSFSSKDTGYQLAVQIPASLSFEKNDILDNKGMMYCKLKVCHTNLNKNKSFISEENMKKALPSLKYRPLLAHIHQLDNGDWDFHSHDMNITDNGIEYIEKQIGAFTADEPYLEYDEDNDKTYVIAYAAIPEDYTMASEIIRNNGGSTVSCELSIEDMSFNAKEGYLELNTFYFSGCTCLGRETNGKEVQPGMEGSRLDIIDFSTENNSMFSKRTEEENSKLIETLEKLNETIVNLTSFNINIKDEQIAQKGGNDLEKINSLIEKYNITIEDVTFETEGLSDEELENIFEEKFGEKVEEVEEVKVEETTTEQEEFSKTCPECGATVDDEVDACPECGKELTEVSEDETEEEFTTEETVVTEEVVATEEAEEVTVEETAVEEVSEPEKFSKTFELSHDDIKCALYQLLIPYEEANNEWYWIVEVFDNHFIYQGCMGNYFGQKYVKEDETVAFDGEPYAVYSEFLTESERVALKEMRANYAVIEEELGKYKEAEVKAQKEEILNDIAYAEFAEEECMKDVVSKASEYSVQELRDAMDLALAKAYKSKKTFAVETEEKKSVTKVGFAYEEVDDKDPYGDYFKSLLK